MINKDFKISKMLNAYPQTLNVLLNASPHFNKLNNKVLRKTLATRVTVEQAAKIAGVELNSLLISLNKAVNNNMESLENIKKDSGEPVSSNNKPEFLNKIDNYKIKQLDVRPIIDSGRDPFTDIMSFIKEVENDEILLLINSFEPIPLYSVLSKKGFEHYTEKNENVFKVYFYKQDSGETSKINSSGNYDKNNGQNDLTNIIEIDVRDLVLLQHIYGA